jgi:hypothetical protein
MTAKSRLCLRLVVIALSLVPLALTQNQRYPALYKVMHNPNLDLSTLGLQAPNLNALDAAGLTTSTGTVADASAITTIPLWTSTETDLGQPWSYTMVGKSPFKKWKVPSTTVNTVIVPVIFQLGTLTWDPTTVDSACSPNGSAIDLTLQSPAFSKHSYTVGGTSAANNTQYTDFFQRANFWTQTKTINPGYHVLLNPTVIAPVTVHLAEHPRALPQLLPACASGTWMLIVDINWWDGYVQNTLMPQLASQGVNPSVLPFFELYNVVFDDYAAAVCCYIGYHNAFNNPSFNNYFQTYAVSEYDATNEFSNLSDITAISHELGEWMDDPTTVNLTPPWGNIGQVSGCQGNLEVGDPLSGTNYPVTMPNGMTYNPQELAFESWFYNVAPSHGVNGWYSSNGTFTSAASYCTSQPLLP